MVAGERNEVTLVRMAAAVRGANQMCFAIRDRSKREWAKRIRGCERANAIALVQNPRASFNAGVFHSLGHCVWFTPRDQAYFGPGQFHVIGFFFAPSVERTRSTRFQRSWVGRA